MQINHIDGVKLNNKLNNLELVTPSENLKHASRLGLIRVQIGTLNNMVFLTEANVLAIRGAKVALRMWDKELAEIFNVNTGTINCVVTRKTWKHI